MQHPTLSVIFCSISQERYDRCSANVMATADVTVELIRIDNRVHEWSIAKAYNEGAKRANGEYLLFLHEDVEFEKHGWGGPLLEKLAEPTCGVVGFIGSKIYIDAISPWWPPTYKPYGYVIGIRDGALDVLRHQDAVDGASYFEPVIVVDGLGMAVRKEVWARCPFDEENLTGFHCYDIDFSLSVAHAGYNNYAYSWGITHFSNGNYDESWLNQTVNLLESKWQPLLPMSLDYTLLDRCEKISADTDYDYIFRFFRQGIAKPLAQKMFRRYMRKSRHSKYYRSHMFVVFWTYLRKYAFKRS